jgi:hypothetical protein
MTKRILAVALLVPLLAVAQPSPAAAQANFSFAIGIPGNPSFGAAVSIPGPYYAPPPCGPPAFLPAPLYAPGPVYVAPPVYGARAYYAPRRVYVPVYRPYRIRPHYGRGHRHW